MLQNERKPDDDIEALTAFLEGWQRKLWTATPGIIQGPVAADGTVSVVPSIKAKVRSPAGVVSDQTLPMLIHCPVVAAGGGGFNMTFPVGAGDECLVVFASRAIDGWWQSGGVQSQVEMRMHDLSDGFAILGVRSKARALSGWSGTTAQLRSDDGTTYIELAPAGVVNIVSTTSLKITAPTVSIMGNLQVSGTVIGGFGGADSVGLTTHKHPTAATGAPSSPTAGT